MFKVTRHEANGTTKVEVRTNSAKAARTIADGNRETREQGSSTYWTVDQD